MPDTREKLIELLNKTQDTGVIDIPAGFGSTYRWIKNEDVASYLIANGVTVHTAEDKPLPTAEEFRAVHPAPPAELGMWSEPKYLCPVCGGGMCKDLNRILLSMPPQHLYKCNRCGNVEYQYR